MRSRALVTLAALAGAVLVLLPLGGGALAATSSGANGDIVFVAGRTTIYRSPAAAGAIPVVDRRHRSVVVARRDEARVRGERRGGAIEMCTDSRMRRVGVTIVGTAAGTRAGLVARRHEDRVRHERRR